MQERPAETGRKTEHSTPGPSKWHNSLRQTALVVDTPAFPHHLLSAVCAALQWRTAPAPPHLAAANILARAGALQPNAACELLRRTPTVAAAGDHPDSSSSPNLPPRGRPAVPCCGRTGCHYRFASAGYCCPGCLAAGTAAAAALAALCTRLMQAGP